MKFREHLAQIIMQLEPEYRVPASFALLECDGTPSGFEAELRSQTWEHPELPVQRIVEQLCTVDR